MRFYGQADVAHVTYKPSTVTDLKITQGAVLVDKGNTKTDDAGIHEDEGLYSGYERDTGNLQVRQPDHPELSQQGTLDLFAPANVPSATAAE